MRSIGKCQQIPKCHYSLAPSLTEQLKKYKKISPPYILEIHFNSSIDPTDFKRERQKFYDPIQGKTLPTKLMYVLLLKQWLQNCLDSVSS